MQPAKFRCCTGCWLHLLCPSQALLAIAPTITIRVQLGEALRQL
jgi:hypothetical protein